MKLYTCMHKNVIAPRSLGHHGQLNEKSVYRNRKKEETVFLSRNPLSPEKKSKGYIRITYLNKLQT